MSATPKFQLSQRKAELITTALIFLVGFALWNMNSRLGLKLRAASYDWSYDLSFFKSGKINTPELVIVYLDEASHIDLKQPFNKPWSRALHAQLLDQITADNAKAVIFDIVFSDPGSDPQADALLAQALRRNGRVVIAADLSDSQPTADQRFSTQEQTLTLPHRPFLEAAAKWGVAQMQPDEDFLVREHNHGAPDSEFVSLSWAAAELLGAPVTRDSAARRKERWVNYYDGPGMISTISYKLALHVPKGFFHDKIVLIGGRPMTGFLRERKDEFRNPRATWQTKPVFMPAAEIHGTILLNLLREDWLRRPAPVLEWLILALGAFVFGARLTRHPPFRAVMVAALAILCVLLFVALLFGFGRIWFPWLIVVAAQAPLGLLCAISFSSAQWVLQRRAAEEERKQAANRIREQAALLDKAQDAIMVHDLRSRTTYWNPSAERLYGWTAREIRERSASDLFGARQLSKFVEVRAATLEKGEWTGQLRQVAKGGREIIVESRWTRVCDESGAPNSILVINTDITEKSKLELQLLRAQRMESIGTLAGGIAHDLNNILNPILMASQVLSWDETDQRKTNLLQTIQTSAQRGGEIVKQVLSFARGHEGEKVLLQIKHIVREMEKMAGQTFPKSIVIKQRIAPDLAPVVGDATQLHQVLLNLCVNARDAMPRGGEILVEARNVALDEAACRTQLGARPGSYVLLQVRDAGLGIPPDIVDRIFEPFFTTKEIGKGTGLGLSTVMSIVKSHQGFIEVASEVNKGATFSVYLPSAAAPWVDKTDSGLSENLRAHGELVLVADDEPLIRNTIELVLRQHNYRVIMAENGAAALDCFRRQAEEIDLVLIDTMMPVMDGTTAIAAMKRIKPQAKFIIMSGASMVKDVNEPGDNPVEALQKPFTPAQLLMALFCARSCRRT